MLRSAIARHRAGARGFSSYGFIGLGRMGMGMVENLRDKVAADAEVFVYDTNPAALRQIEQSRPGKVRGSGSLADMARHAECIVTMLPDSSHVEECFRGDKGLCFKQTGIAEALAKEGCRQRLYIDCSTIDPFRSKAVGEYIRELGVGRFVDAPVSGGVTGAKQGTLTFMVGLEGEDAEVRDVLSTMGADFHFCGPPGSGLAAKLTNNYMLALNNIATCEGMNLGLRLGLKPDVLGRVINSSTGKCWPSEKNNPVEGIVPGAPCERGFDGGFGVQLMKKDLNLAVAAAKGCGAYLGAKDYAQKVYELADDDDRYKGKDFGVVYRMMAEMSQ